MEQKIFTFDSQILNTFQSCARKYQYSFIDLVHPVQKAEALEKGELIHRFFEAYYSLQLAGFKFNTPYWRDLLEAGFEIPSDRGFPSIQSFSIKAGQFYASRMDLPSEEVFDTTYQFREYTNYYQKDVWNPLAVEEVGSKVIYDTEAVKIIYNFKIDLVAEHGNVIAPFDHKTSRRRQEPSSLSNQFIGYCYGLGVNNIVINKIGFQKTLSPSQRFNRFILTIDDDRIEEWRKNTIWWAFEMMRAQSAEHYPMNFTSCDKYSGCIFCPICETDPESRQLKIDRNFMVGEKWDVAKELEK